MSWPDLKKIIIETEKLPRGVIFFYSFIPALEDCGPHSLSFNIIHHQITGIASLSKEI